VTLKPGESVTIEEYKVTYQSTRMEVDAEKRMLFADLDVVRHGKPVGKISPAKFIYKAMGETPTSEVARHITVKNDLYVVLGMANPTTKTASFQLHVNNLISFMWFGAAILVLGAIVAMWPEISFDDDDPGAFAYVRAAGSVVASLVFGLLLAGGPAMAYGGPDIVERDGPRIEVPDDVWRGADRQAPRRNDAMLRGGAEPAPGSQ
jgi:cytochrome c-type biogenesis protein CcmF